MKSNKVMDKSIIVNSIVGEGAEFKGEFRHNGTLRIDGKIEGLVETQGKVFVGAKGTANCDITAQKIVIGGKVKGNLKAYESITIQSTGEVIGNIIAPRVIMEDGTSITGHCLINEELFASGDYTDTSLFEKDPMIPEPVLIKKYDFTPNFTKVSLEKPEKIEGDLPNVPVKKLSSEDEKSKMEKTKGKKRRLNLLKI